MDHNVFGSIVAYGRQPSVAQKTVEYLAEHLGGFVKPGDRVLLCAEKSPMGDLGCLMEQAVLRCGGSPILWEEDRRWKQLLRLAFSSRATTVIGPPLVLMGLSKLKRAKHTPLFVHNVVVVGYPCLDWMMEGIAKGFDCQVHSCFSLGNSGVVAGFSCDSNCGIHLREGYSLDILDEEGNVLPTGQLGRWRLSPKDHPELSFSPGGIGKLETAPCACGNSAPRILELQSVDAQDKELSGLGQYLLSWTSVLDFTLQRGPYGLELEMIIFPGRKLPVLPTCARQVVRPWDPDHDEPFPYVPGRKNAGNLTESY